MTITTRPLPVFKVTVEYDGTDFAGWQRQPGRRTVQGDLEAACSRLAGGPVAVRGAGRTDAGTHAVGQVAAVTLPWWREPARLLTALNGLLPQDVAVVSLAPAPAAFDPRRGAVVRWYRYLWLVRHARSPLLRRFTALADRPLDVAAMRGASRLFLGTHDFSAFTTKAAAERGATRTMRRIALVRRGPLLVLDVEGDAFLQHMVRLIAGSLQAVGDAGLAVPALRHALATGKGPLTRPAPALGLALMWVGYPGDARPAPAWPPGVGQ
jgi:tRNA pseudouridine38-40 synthase